MAILQISRITNRKGLTENLPQLAGAEFGWCVDSRRLFIGNGTLEEGAPTIGNTEILTEFSDIASITTYTYADVAVGYAAQTGPTTSDPVVRTVQKKLDDFASIRDFGAVGNGVADDTQAINRALYQLYCVETNSQVRRTLYFPAGTYKITETIIIPTYAKLVGEGSNCTIIYLDTSSDISSLSAYVARYGDSLQQTGVDIGTNGATPPQNIEISSMTFQSVETTDVFLVDQAKQCWFDSVTFTGPYTTTDVENSGVTPLDDIAGLRFNSTASLVCNDITFDRCAFVNNTYGIKTDQSLQAITISNSKFDVLYQGVVLSGTDPTGVRVVHNMFDNIFAEGIAFGSCNLNISAYNAFYNVGDEISGSVTYPCVSFANDNCLSLSDLFTRTDTDAYAVPRVQQTTSTNTSGGTQITLGRYTRDVGRTFTLANNASNQVVMYVNNNDVKAFKMFYTQTRSTSVRTGVLTVIANGTTTYVDDYSENTTTGVTLDITQSGANTAVIYTTTNTGTAGIMTYSISHLA